MKLASIELISEIQPHLNADKLEIVKILNWQCVVKKNLHTIGEKIVYIPIDTLIPDKPWSEFLHQNKNKKYVRLVANKLRGEVSRGLVLPITVLPEDMQKLDVGTDVGEVLGIKKYEKEVPSHLLDEVAGSFPTHIIPQTDEENGLSDPDLVKKVLESGPVTITQKLDGSSATIVIKDGKITHVCSRRIWLKENPESIFWIAAYKINIPKNWSGCIQAETVGPGIQKNQLRLFDPEFRVFNIKKDNGSFMNYIEMAMFCKELDLQPVPIIEYKAEGFEIDKLQDLANRQLLPNGKPAEGIVVRSLNYDVNEYGRPLGFKLINENYKD